MNPAYQTRGNDRLSVFAPYSALNKGRVRNITYGGAHDHGAIERGDHHLETIVPVRPFLVNTRDISIDTRHNKAWDTDVYTIGRNGEPHFNQYGPPVFMKGNTTGNSGRRNGLSYR